MKTELQLLFICHLIGPFFARLEKERTRVLTDVVIELYQIILQVSQNTVIVHADTIGKFILKYNNLKIKLIKLNSRSTVPHQVQARGWTNQEWDPADYHSPAANAEGEAEVSHTLALQCAHGAAAATNLEQYYFTMGCRFLL